MKKKLTIFLLLLATISFSQVKNNYSKKENNTRQSYVLPANSKISEEVLAKSVSVTQYLPKNADKQAKVDYTEYVQKVIDNNKIVVFPNFPILINDKGLQLKSNQTIIFQKNSSIILKPTSKGSYSILNLNNISNVEIHYPNLIGDWDKHLGKDGEWGMGIKLIASNNIKIMNPSIKKCWGDGIYISRNGDSNSSDVFITNAFIDSNRRNGISIISGENISILNSKFSNMNGSLPMSGIDIEPNSNKDVVNNITIDNVQFLNNTNSGLQIGLSKLQGKYQKKINIKVKNIDVKNSKYGILVGGLYNNDNFSKMDGLIDLSNIVLTNCETPLKMYYYYNKGPKIQFNKVKFLDSNMKMQTKKYDSFKSFVQKRPNVSIN
ncbi:right-handed parallel beta-helix repeat-containing protein [Empedobacter brevis]|uniref:right-handed parallel beta-helix repeat-containing protein n=1 Tax=Empedobacter brevis TaxID=247 RepID=UPI0028D0F521|nr:right-handed parallel beta-helix repeat-containing protein [Empedobacter brevis]